MCKRSMEIALAANHCKIFNVCNNLQSARIACEFLHGAMYFTNWFPCDKKKKPFNRASFCRNSWKKAHGNRDFMFLHTSLLTKQHPLPSIPNSLCPPIFHATSHGTSLHSSATEKAESLSFSNGVSPYSLKGSPGSASLRPPGAANALSSSLLL